jgi:periplasmic protein CpxP/Spy
MTALQTKMTRMALLAVCSAALTAPLAVFAQDAAAPPLPPAQQDGGGPGGPGGHYGGGRGDMQQREQHQQEMLTRRLNLTADQQASVKQIFADSDAKMMALFTDDSTPREEKRPKMMAIQQDRTAAIRNVLTPEQQPQYDAIVAEEKARMQDRGGQGHGQGYGQDGYGQGGYGGGNPPPPPPPQQ